MGCFGSRLDKRADSVNWNTAGTQFVGGEANEFDKFPFDRVLWGLDAKKECAEHFDIGDDMAANNEDQIKAAYKHVMDLASKHSKDAEDKAKGDKDVQINGKWKASEVAAHWKDTIEQFEKHTGLKEEKEGEKKEGEGEKEMEMEGGDEMEKEADPEGAKGMESAGESPFKYEGDSRDYAGWKNFPALLLRNMIVNGSFFDEAKANAVAWEFSPNKGPDCKDWNNACALVSAAAAKATTSAQTVWISGWAGEEDHLSLQDIAGKSKAIHFPWVSVGWATQEEAVNALKFGPEPKNKGDLHQVLFEVSDAAAFKFVECRLVCHRLNGTIDAVGESKEGGLTHYKVAAVALEAQTVAEWEKARAAPAATDDKKEDDKKEDDKMEEEKKEEEKKEE